MCAPDLYPLDRQNWREAHQPAGSGEYDQNEHQSQHNLASKTPGLRSAWHGCATRRRPATRTNGVSRRGVSVAGGGRHPAAPAPLNRCRSSSATIFGATLVTSPQPTVITKSPGRAILATVGAASSQTGSYVTSAVPGLTASATIRPSTPSIGSSRSPQTSITTAWSALSRARASSAQKSRVRV